MSNLAPKVTERVNEVLLKLLDGFEQEIPRLRSGESPNLRAYETLCRAEAARRGGGG
jgi:hypothetical protein